MTNPTCLHATVRAMLAASLATSLAGQTMTLLKDIEPGSTSSYPGAYTDMFGTTLFLATRGTSTEIWRTDGSPAGTVAVAKVSTTSVGAGMVRLGGSAFVVTSNNSGGGALWVSDGTAAGTRQLGSLALRGFLQRMAVAGDRFFFVDQTTPDDDLWCSDGTLSGTRKLATFNRGLFMTTVGDLLVFTAAQPATGYELWRSDGTAGGTRIVKDIRAGAAGGIRTASIARSRDGVFVIADDGSGPHLWKSDGTGTGTVLWSRIGASSDWPELVGAAGDHVYYVRIQAPSVYELWAVHRTTRTAIKLRTGAGVGDGFEFGDRLWFLSWSGNKLEIWSTDATVAGTGFVALGDTKNRRHTVAGSRSAFLDFHGGLFVTGAATRNLDPAVWLVGGTTVSDGRVYTSGRTNNSLWEPYVVTLDASSVPIGTGLGVELRVPELSVTDPVLGTSARVRLRSAVAGANMLLFLSAGLPRPWRFAPGAYAYVDAAQMLMVGVPLQAETWSANLPVPNDPSLRGLPVVFQALLTGTRAARGFELTNAVHARVGR